MTTATVSEFLDRIVSNGDFTRAGVVSHETWYAGMEARRIDLKDPFMGQPPDGQFARVQDFEPAFLPSVLQGKSEKADTSDGSRVVYDPNFCPFHKLELRVQREKSLPMLNLCIALVALLTPNAQVKELERTLNLLLAGQAPLSLRVIINAIDHAASQAFQMNQDEDVPLTVFARMRVLEPAMLMAVETLLVMVREEIAKA